MRTLVLEPENYSTLALESYRSLGSVQLGYLSGAFSNISLLVVRLEYSLDEKFLNLFPFLVAIVSPTTGLTHIDLEVCRSRNIKVYSLAECREALELVTSTSELTLGLIIGLLRSIPRAIQDVVNQGLWNRDNYRSRQLSCQTLGLVGLGRIGGHVAGYAQALGMRVLACDPYQPATRFSEVGAEQCDLVSLLEQSDILTVHANLRADNHGLIGTKQLSSMKTGSFLVNTARGALLDELAVVSALRTGQLAGVAVDVLASEHTGKSWADSPLVGAARTGLNVIITPHIGGCTSDAMHVTEECLAKIVARKMKEGL